jgi:ribosomal protein S18 acetylase RimI-like enzyme
MSIRRAEQKDIDDILRLLTQVNMVHHRIRPDLFRGPATKYSRDELEQMICVKKAPIFVFPDDSGHVLGYIFCEEQVSEESPLRTGIRTLYIDDLCVDEILRGQHIGRQLYDYVVQFAKDSGCYNVTLNVWSCNESAMHFYEKCGLKPQKIGMEVIL